MSDLHLGYNIDTGVGVTIPINHTLLTGKTRHGKSVTMESLARRAADQGYSVLLFDVKTPRDYDDFDADIPIFIDEATNPTRMKQLLENQSGMSLSFQYAELIKVYEHGDTYRDIYERLDEMLASDEDRHPVQEDKLRVLHHLLHDLISDLDAVEITDDLTLTDGINVMDLHSVGSEVQQIAIQSTVDRILDDEGVTDVIICIDEAHNFIPQRKKPPANDTINRALREGGAKGVWVYLSDQTITGIDKDPLKQVETWVLGKQKEKNEAQRVLDQIPGRSEHSSDDVMTLERGHFIVALDDAQPLVYVQPPWMDAVDAQDIATGTLAMDDASPPQQTDTDTVEQLEEELDEKAADVRRLKEEIGDRDDRIEELQHEVDKLSDLLESEDGSPDPDPAEPAPVDEATIEAIVEDHLEAHIEEVDVAQVTEIERNQPKLIIRNIVEPLELDDSTLKGKIAILYAQGALPDDNWLTTGTITDIIKEHGWGDDAKGSSVMDDFVHLGLFKKQYSGRRPEWKMVVPPEEAKDAGLIEYETVER